MRNRWKLTEFVRGELELPQIEELLDHLEECEDCR